VLFGLWDGVRRWRAGRTPFPERWRRILTAQVPFYGELAADERSGFEHKLMVFARTKAFEGARGFTITEEVKVVVAACAARLTMHMPDEHYEALLSIVIYASHYKHQDGAHVVFGEANDRGVVVLSWEAVQRGLADPRDGHDTAVHELAHALDIEDGSFDGTPELGGEAYAPWARVMTAAYDGLRQRKKKRRAVLRDYGAQNPAEFFAVSTEAFFEKPVQLKARHPELYAELAAYFRSDPATRRGTRASSQE
jgi:MtfA peptidase